MGVYDDGILCEHCERLFAKWDDYAAELFLASWPPADHLRHRGEHVGWRIPGHDYSKLKLFFISLLWRASVSTHVMFSNIDAGEFEPELKASIARADPGGLDHFGVMLQAFDTTQVGMLDPHWDDFSGVRFARFYIGHVIAFVKVDLMPIPEDLVAVALTPNQPLMISLKKFIGSPERKIMQNLVIADSKRPRRT